MKNSTTTVDWRTVNNYLVLGGSAIIAVSAAFQLTKVSSAKQAILPLIFLLTGVAAFNCAMAARTSAI